MGDKGTEGQKGGESAGVCLVSCCCDKDHDPKASRRGKGLFQLKRLDRSC